MTAFCRTGWSPSDRAAISASAAGCPTSGPMFPNAAAALRRTEVTPVPRQRINSPVAERASGPTAPSARQAQYWVWKSSLDSCWTSSGIASLASGPMARRALIA